MEGKDGQERSCVLSMAVRYGAELDGRPLLGKATAVVSVAADGRIVGFTHWIQHAEPAETVRLRPTAAALDDMRLGLGQCPSDATSERLARVTIESVDIAYYGPPTPIDEQYYKPIYVFHIRMANGTTGDWLLSAFDASG